MGFKAAVISREENLKIKEQMMDEVDQSIETYKETLEETKESKRPVKSKTTVKKGKNGAKDFMGAMDSVVIEAGIDRYKWEQYKKDVMLKSLTQMEDTSTYSIALPNSLVKPLKDMCDYSGRIQMKTIISNLIVAFLEKNKDIMEILEKEHNKKWK